MAKIFVSHAHEDKDVAHQITGALAEAGLEPWLDVQELYSGDELLRRIAEVLTKAEYFSVVITRRALTKPWVLTEMRMALTSEIEHGRPKVIVLLLEDCEVPIELRHKLYLDFRGRFDAALTELAEHVQGVARAAPTPKQLVLAQMIETTDDELWAWLCPYSSPDDNWSRREFSDAIRNLRSDELEAAVAIGWSARAGYKMYESDLLGTIRRATGARDASARRMIRTLADDGFLEEAEADYRGRELAWYDKKILWNLRRVAQRSGLFSAIPPPFPERLSGLLAYERPGLFVGRGWRAIRFHEPLLTVLDASEPVTVVVVRCDEPARTWAFRSPDDRIPLRAARSIMETELTAVHPLAWRGHPRFIYDLPLPFDLAKFDDLGLLCA